MTVRDLLEQEFMGLEIKMTAKGLRREDGKTAAEVEEEMAAKAAEEEAHGAE